MKAIIVDDERLARNELKRLLENFPTIEVIAEASNTEEAGPLVEELKPDVAYLTHISHQLGKHKDVNAKLPKNVFCTDNQFAGTDEERAADMQWALG